MQFGSAQAFGSDARKKTEALRDAIEGMAEEPAGDPARFHLKSPSYQSS